MCEKRTRKIKKGSQMTRLREARRLQRLQRLTSPPIHETYRVPHPSTVNKIVQNRVILELAWKTVALMQKNKVIQEKINDLKKETNEFVETVMSNPINKKRYLEHMRLYGSVQGITQVTENNEPIKLD